MNRNPNVGMYAVAVVIGVVGALWVGVPVGTLVVLAVALACPLMMMFMMGGKHDGMRGGDDEHDRSDRHSHQHH